MSDIIQEVHTIFVEQFGGNMREWPEGMVEFKKKITNHVSKSTKLYKQIGAEEKTQEIRGNIEAILE